MADRVLPMRSTPLAARLTAHLGELGDDIFEHGEFVAGDGAGQRAAGAQRLRSRRRQLQCGRVAERHQQLRRGLVDRAPRRLVAWSWRGRPSARIGRCRRRRNGRLSACRSHPHRVRGDADRSVDLRVGTSPSARAGGRSGQRRPGDCGRLCRPAARANGRTQRLSRQGRFAAARSQLSAKQDRSLGRYNQQRSCSKTST